MTPASRRPARAPDSRPAARTAPASGFKPDSGLRTAQAQERLRRHAEVPVLCSAPCLRPGSGKESLGTGGEWGGRERPHRVRPPTFSWEAFGWKDFRKFESLHIKIKSSCRNPGSNQGPLDLQSNALPTELFRLSDKRRSWLNSAPCRPAVRKRTSYSMQETL